MKGVTERLQRAHQKHNIQLFSKAGYTIRNVGVHCMPKGTSGTQKKNVGWYMSVGERSRERCMRGRWREIPK